MQQDLSDYRKNYTQSELIEDNLTENPIELFRDWFLEADKSENIEEANAMCVSTIGLDGYPKNRVVLLKKYNEEGFIFYTNYNSEKGRALLENNKVCLSFFWSGLERQIIIKGDIEKIPTNLSDGYFETRPRGSKLGAWASEQSTIVPSKDFLNNRLKEFDEKYNNSEIPRPEYWGGLITKPFSIEFWQGRPNRMHDRIRYTLQKDFSWKIERLAP